MKLSAKIALLVLTFFAAIGVGATVVILASL